MQILGGRSSNYSYGTLKCTNKNFNVDKFELYILEEVLKNKIKKNIEEIPI